MKRLPVIVFATAAVVLFGSLLLYVYRDRVPSITAYEVGRLDPATDKIVQVKTFSTKDRAFYCRARLYDPLPGFKLRARWVAVNVPGGPKNETIREQITPLDASKESVQVDLKRDDGFPKGDYRIDLFIDSQTKTETHPGASLDFDVE